MKLLNSLISIIFIFSIFFHTEKTIAQNHKINTALEISKGSKIKYLKHGKKVKIWYEGQKYKVWIDSIGQNEIFTSEKKFEINKIDKIAIRFKPIVITGGIVGSVGLTVIGIGIYIIIDSLQFGDFNYAFYWIITDIECLPGTIFAAYAFLFRKKYKKSKGWEFKAVQIE